MRGTGPSRKAPQVLRDHPHKFLCSRKGSMQIDGGVIGVHMVTTVNEGPRSAVGIQSVQERPEDTPLRYPRSPPEGRRDGPIVLHNTLRTSRQVRAGLLARHARPPKGSKSVDQHIEVDHIEGLRQINRNKKRDMTDVHSSTDIVHHT
ncbi:unnamed protein product [Trichogramma brassicae]|uniref:Uncharacterized protein n=1 Tax=Trichogramma brassicae TaxID=86971 RepID=A0A6H5IC87_9HYME|nr:unnamed protein product [Trichogramma brassicae]